LLTQADDEIQIVAYAISSAAPLFFQQLTAALQRGVRVRLIINRFALQPLATQQACNSLLKQFPHLLHLFSFVPQRDEADLHAKIIVVDRYHALIGSANLSLRGLMDNHELGVIITGAGAVEVARAIDVLVTSPYIFPVSP
jgi:phosphatidylserine/phosphatidylglycerophosphate/cardiolipin synthase-like enzyme